MAEQTASLRAIMENNPIAIVVVDLDRRIRMCNPAFQSVFQCRQAEIIGMDLDELIAPEEMKSEALRFSARASSGETVRANTQRRRQDGTLVDVQIVAVPLMVNGKCSGSFAMYEDITERNQAELARRQAEERLRMLFENAVEGIFQASVDGHLLSVNPALARMCGYASAEEMVASGQDVSVDFYAEPKAREEFTRRMQADGAVERFEYQLKRKNGSKIWVSENARVVRDASGTVVAYEGTMEDITDLKRAEVERQATFEIIRSVNVTDNLDDLLYLIHQALKKVLYADNCFVALYEPSSRMFHFPFFVDEFDQAPPPQQVGRSCTAHVFKTGRAMLIPQSGFRPAGGRRRSGTGRNAFAVVAGRAIAHAGRNHRRGGGAALRERNCLQRARPGVPVVGGRADCAGHRTQARGRKNSGKRSAAARAGRAIAGRACGPSTRICVLPPRWARA